MLQKSAGLSGFLVFVWFVVTPFAQAEPTFQSLPQQTRLVELYTSEGCSSCPRADQWFGGLKNRSGLWKDFVPIAFHVTIWDYLGWKDELASPLHTNRQRDYATSWRARSIYTPCLVLDGREWRGWNRVNDIPHGDKKEAGILSVRAGASQQYYVDYRPPETSQAFTWSSYAALLGFGIHSRIKAGENRGRELHHDFAVLDFKNIELRESEGVFSSKVSLNPNYALAVERYGLAVWVAKAGESLPVQAVGGYLD